MDFERSKLWMERVEYDIQTAEAMLEAGRYIYAVFMCQQAIEKGLKGFLAHGRREVLPIHNLRRIAELAEVVDDLGEDRLQRLDFLSQYYINARYKESLHDLQRGITEEFARECIRFSKDVIQWLDQKMK